MVIELKGYDQKVKIDAGELISYQVAGHEYIHQKGDPGWRNADTEMFPIIGPTAEAQFRVQVPKGNAIQDQHGLLREMEYELLGSSATKAEYVKKYASGTVIKNSKYPEKSTAQWLIWPFNFEFVKSYELTERGLKITFTISGERDMPFMLGYHPAFKLHSDNPTIHVSENTISLDEILAVGSRALEVPEHNFIILRDKKDLEIRTEGFGNFMLWTEVPNMICIEPITFYPYAVNQTELHKGFQHLGDGPMVFKVFLIPQKP